VKYETKQKLKTVTATTFQIRILSGRDSHRRGSSFESLEV